MAYVNGDRSEVTCKELWGRIPDSYRSCRTFSDFWKAYASVFSAELHLSVGKETGETAHMERWNNTLRQRVGRRVRKTLSFSKDASWHDGVIYWFAVPYNSSLSVNV
ncbi:IS1 transposase [Methyloglobulus morosus KoM1]|uniref:IS1 transposase n=1 Tax=Methyloglobulus morosus KoM1 TaxID=1116472 RepID=V5BDP7_9GAMM|nr:IS1 transposase [Methyloglobulus morosus KoM1]